MAELARPGLDDLADDAIAGELQEIPGLHLVAILMISGQIVHFL
jgi:hypothetical protein